MGKLAFTVRRARALVVLWALLAAFLCPTGALAYDASRPQNLAAEDLVGDAAIVVDGDTGKVLFGKYEDMKMFPASTTKTMTLLLAIEYGHLDDQITIPQEAHNVASDSSLVPVVLGEKMIFRDLLYGLIINSGNDAANAIAMIVSGSLEGFVARMNERAQELGCTNTHFANAHGYQDPDHYTTAHDLALITLEGMKHPEYRQIVAAKQYVMPKTNKRDPLTLNSKVLLFDSSSEYYYKYCIGVKTGTTSAAGECFVGAGFKNDKELISVTLASSEFGRWTDTKRLLEYGYTLYDEYSFAQLMEHAPIYVSVKNASDSDREGGLLSLTPMPGETDEYSVLCLKEEFSEKFAEFSQRMRVEYTRELTAPVTAGDVFGTLTVTGTNGKEYSTLLIASRDVEKQPDPFSLTQALPWLEGVNMEFVRFVAYVVLALIALIVILRVRRNIRRSRRRKALLKRQQALKKRKYMKY